MVKKNAGDKENAVLGLIRADSYRGGDGPDDLGRAEGEIGLC